ncbi:endospore germination permease [Paenibacillus sp. SI8]|uniref:GerAB/ArcD/ProY family transporter n=1 Tax=unclassified Paenibacillus TaxID=185978 RepID=UPI003466388F
MLEKGQISSFQMGIMMYSEVLGTAFLALPTITAQFAKNDLWLTGVFASIAGVLSVFIAIKLHDLYPKMNFIQYSTLILGNFLGKTLGCIYFLYIVSISGIVTRLYAEFVTGNFLFKTPILLVVGTMILLCAFAVRGGIEVLARCAIIFTPIFILPLFILLLLIPDLDVKNIFPVLSNGIIPVLKGSSTPQGWISEFFLINFLLPSLVDLKKSMKWSMISLTAVSLSLIYVYLIILFLLGPDTGDKNYPILVAFRYIRLGNLFENMEALLLAMWVVGNFVKICIFFYVSVISFAQVLNLSDYRPVIFPLGMLIIVLSFWDIPNFPSLANFIRYITPFHLTTAMLLIPLFLLLISIIRKRKKAGEGEAA